MSKNRTPTANITFADNWQIPIRYISNKGHKYKDGKTIIKPNKTPSHDISNLTRQRTKIVA